MRSIAFQQEPFLSLVYKGLVVEKAFKPDFIVENQAVLEIKAVQAIHPVDESQLITYLRLSGIRTGLLINFNVRLLKQGITRRVV